MEHLKHLTITENKTKVHRKQIIIINGKRKPKNAGKKRKCTLFLTLLKLFLFCIVNRLVVIAALIQYWSGTGPLLMQYIILIGLILHYTDVCW